MDIKEKLHIIQQSISLLHSEILIASAIIILIIISLRKKLNPLFPILISIVILLISTFTIINEIDQSVELFGGLIRKENFSGFLKALVNIAAILTCVMSLNKRQRTMNHLAEYCALIFSIVLGAHFLLMSNNLLMIFLSLEVVSISSYVLAGYASDKKGSEGSLKYFFFGSVASALMLYGFSILYGLTGSIDFTSEYFAQQLINQNSSLTILAGLMALSGFLFKISAAPMHPWAPDVYEAAPIPVVAFLSVAPKLAGIGVFAKFILAMNLFGQSTFDWQKVVAIIALLTITVGNFSALAQKNPKRLMAYSSIAQSGFLLISLAAFIPQGLHFMLFYASVYTVMNYLVFIYLEYFEMNGISSIEDYKGVGKSFVWPSIFLLIGLIALTGLPPTSGFTAKLFIFSSLWESYQLTGKTILLWLLIFGLLNTVISLFYYLKIPYYAFLKEGQFTEKQNFITIENLLGFILVVVILTLFFVPDLLMGWINKVNFVF